MQRSLLHRLPRGRLIAAVLALAVALMACSGGGGGTTLVSSNPQLRMGVIRRFGSVTVPARNSATATAVCQPDEQLMSGGYSFTAVHDTSYVHTSALGDVSDSYPSDAHGLVATTTATAWTVTADNELTSPITLLAFANCLQTEVLPATIHLTNVPVTFTDDAPHKQIATCSGAVLGGGYESGGGRVYASRPEANGWSVTEKGKQPPDAGSGHPVTQANIFVLCETRQFGAAPAASMAITIPADPNPANCLTGPLTVCMARSGGAGSLSCPTGQLLTGGGSEVTSPSQTGYAIYHDAVDPNFAHWTVEVQTSEQMQTQQAGGAAGSMTIWAACVHPPAHTTVAAPVRTIQVHAVQVSDDNGQRPANITPQQVQQWVTYANSVYSAANIQLQFIPSANDADWSTVQSTLLNNMTGDTDANWTQEVAAGNQVAAQYLGQIVVLFRYGPGASPTGGGFSSYDYNFAVLPGFSDTFVCGHQNISIFAHELGHYLGILHTFAEYKTMSDAQQALAAADNDPETFDPDALADTPAEPYLDDDQVSPCQSSATSLTVNTIQFQLARTNIMSYYDSPQKFFSPQQVDLIELQLQSRGLQ